MRNFKFLIYLIGLLMGFCALLSFIFDISVGIMSLISLICFFIILWLDKDLGEKE